MANEKRILEVQNQLNSLSKILGDLALEISQPQGDCSSTTTRDNDLFQSIAGYLIFQSDEEQATLLEKTLQCAMHVVGANGAGLTLYDSEKKKLVFKAAIGDGAEGIIGYEVPLKGSQHGLAFATGEVQSATPIHSDTEKAANAVFRNVLVAPLLVDDEGVGTMSAVNKKDADHFTPEDMEAYQMFADLAAQIIRQNLRGQMFEQQMRGETSPENGELQELLLSEEDQMLFRSMQTLAAQKNTRPELMALCCSIIDKVCQS